MDLMTHIALKQQRIKAENKPILYWECWKNNSVGKPYRVIDCNNSVAILRNKYGNVGFTYKAIR